MTLNLEYHIVIYIQLVIIFVFMAAIVALYISLKRKRKQLQLLKAEIDYKISESVKLYVQKSEQDIQLFFDFEDVLTNIYKLIKKLITEQEPMKKIMENIETLLSELIKKS